MNSFARKAVFFPGILLLLSGALFAQQLAQRPPAALAATAAQETVLDGEVLSYTATATAPPLGAHVVLKTASGVLDISLGPASYLQDNHFALAAGDLVRIAGVTSATRQGSIFLARVIQKRGQSLLLRTAQGAPLGPAGARASAAGAQKVSQPGGAR